MENRSPTPSRHIQISISGPLLTNFAIQVPLYDLADDWPLETRMPNSLPIDEEGNPQYENRSGYACHRSKSVLISRLGNPRICVEREQETEGSCQ